jgi:hypothetical protein
MHIVSSYGPQFSVSSCCRRPHELAVLYQSNEPCCSVRESVSERRVVPVAPPPAAQPNCLPVAPRPTRSTTRIEPSYGPKTAVVLLHPRFHKELHRHRRRFGIESYQAKETRRSAKDNVSERWAEPLAMPPHMQVGELPVERSLMHLQTRSRHSYGPQSAVSSNFPCFHHRTRCRRLEKSMRRHSDAVCVKRPVSKVKSVTKSNTLLAFAPDPCKRAYSPGAAPRASDPSTGTERVGRRLGECYPPRNEGEWRTRRPPEWCERDQTVAPQIGMHDERHVSHRQTRSTRVSQVVLINYLHYIHCRTHSATCTNHPDDHKVAILSTPQSDLMHMHQVATHDARHALQKQMCFVVLTGVSKYSPDCFFWELGCSNYITLPAGSSSVFLTEFPGCYSVQIPITLNIQVQCLSPSCTFTHG